MRFYVSQKRIAIILLHFFLQAAVCGIHLSKSFTGYHYLAFGTNFFPKITTAKTPTTADRQLRHAHTETS